MFLPIPLTKPRRWMNLKVRYLERRWFDDFGEFYTYLLKNSVIEEIIDEEELVSRIAKLLFEAEIHPVQIDEMKEYIINVFGIAEEYVDLILDKVKYELVLLEAEIKKIDEIEHIEEEIDKDTLRQIMYDVQKMYFELDFDRNTILKEISLTYGLPEEKVNEIVSWVESYIFS